jgi:hypothetical protein
VGVGAVGQQPGLVAQARRVGEKVQVEKCWRKQYTIAASSLTLPPTPPLGLPVHR